MRLLLESIGEEHFRLVDGSMEDFLIIKKWSDFYRDHATKKPISIEEMNYLVPLVEKLINGVEHGIYSVENWKKDLQELSTYLSDRGYTLKTQP